jgi:hypothetical protein
MAEKKFQTTEMRHLFGANFEHQVLKIFLRRKRQQVQNKRFISGLDKA